jgi:hypothetical protein
MNRALAVLLLAALLDAATGHAAPPAPPPLSAAHPSERLVEIVGPRVRASALIAGAGDVDLGPTPPIGSTRLLDRAEIERAFAEAAVPPPAKIPKAVRVTRRTRRLAAADVAQAVRVSLAETKLARGASLVSVAAMPAEVPAEMKRVTVQMPILPRKAGIVSVHAPIAFLDDAGVTVHAAVATLKLSLPPEAAFADINKGGPISLVIKKGLVEVTAAAVAGSDADIGTVLPVTVKPSGRVIRARALDKDHAVALEDS